MNEKSYDIPVVNDEEIDSTPTIKLDDEKMPDGKSRGIESLQHFFGKRSIVPFDNSEILRCRLLYQIESSKYKGCKEVINKETGKTLGIVTKMQLKHSWRMANSKDAQKVVKNKLFFMTYEQWQQDLSRIEKYIQQKRVLSDYDLPVFFNDVWSMSEAEYESVGLARPQQFMALLQTAILGEMEENRRTIRAWGKIKKYAHKVPLEAANGGIFSPEDARKLSYLLNIKCLNDIRKLNIYALKNAVLEFNFEKIVKDINRAYKEDLARRKDFRYKVHPFVSAFLCLAGILYVAYNFKYTLIKDYRMTDVVMILLTICVIDAFVVIIGGLRGKRRRLVRPTYVYYSPKVKRSVKWFAFIGIFTVLSVFVFYQRYDGYDKTFYYRDLDDGTIAIAGLTGEETVYDLHIPDTIDGKVVTKIDKLAFYNDDISSANMPKTIKEIDILAFGNCKGLNNISIPAHVEVIKHSTFKNSGIETLTFEENCSVAIGKKAFSNCAQLQTVENMAAVTSIADKAFVNCSSLTDFDLSDNLKTIGKKAFLRCYSITTLRVPASVTAIGKKAFYYCNSITNLEIPFAGTTAEESLNQSINKIVKFEYNNMVNVTFNSSYTIGAKAFNGIQWISSLTLNDGITEIVPGAFENTPYLQSVKMSLGITNIYDSMFEGASSLKTVTGLGKVTSVGNKAFYGCQNLTSVDLELVETIGDSAFYGCSVLTKLGTLSSLRTVGESGFRYCTGLEAVEFSSTLVSVGGYAFSDCDGFSSIDLSSTSLSSLGSFAFSNCNNLTEIALPSEMTNISNGLFAGCESFNGFGSISNLDDLSITSIAESAFEGCNMSGMDVSIPDGVTSIGERAFANTSMYSLTVPTSVLSVGKNAFSECTRLVSASLPFLGQDNNYSDDGYTWTFGSIGVSEITLTSSSTVFSKTFAGGGKSIVKVELSEGVTKIENAAFANFGLLNTVILPSSITSLGDGVFENCTSLNSINIPTSITSIPKAAFKNCQSLVNFDFATSNLKSIGEEAFMGSSVGSVGTLMFNEGLTTIGKNAFSRCGNIYSVTFSTTMTIVNKEAFGSDPTITLLIPTKELVEKYTRLFEGYKNVKITSI